MALPGKPSKDSLCEWMPATAAGRMIRDWKMKEGRGTSAEGEGGGSTNGGRGNEEDSRRDSRRSGELK